MRVSLLFLLFPIVCAANCDIELEEVVPLVKHQLQPLHERPNSRIDKAEFVRAHGAVSEVIVRLDSCAKYYHEYELENLHFKQWGEKSDIYRSYSMWLTSVEMQLDAAVDSFKYWIFRSWFIDVDMWEKVAKEFYTKET